MFATWHDPQEELHGGSEKDELMDMVDESDLEEEEESKISVFESTLNEYAARLVNPNPQDQEAFNSL